MTSALESKPMPEVDQPSTSSNGSTQTPCEILCEWAWAKARLDEAQNNNPGAVASAIVDFRHANRKKRQLDEAYAWHHELLHEFKVDVFASNVPDQRPGESPKTL